MRAAHAFRRPFRTLDYEAETELLEADTDLILPLTRRHSSVVPSVRAKHALARPATPMIVDKRQLVQLVRVLRVVPPTVPPRIRHLSAMVRDERAAKARRARERIWLRRIGFLAVIGLAMFAASRPVVGVFMHQTCVSVGGCAGAR